MNAIVRTDFDCRSAVGEPDKELNEALQELAGQDLDNVLEGVAAQVNRHQRGKLVGAEARKKSLQNGFFAREHKNCCLKS